MPKTVTITPEQLRDALTANPDASQAKIAKLLNVGYSTLLKKLAKENGLNAVWTELRGEIKAKGISDELLRKIQHEFNHIVIYDEKGAHFDEVAEQVAAIK